ILIFRRLAIKNAQDGISMIQTYEGALTETDSILQRMKTLADQAANGTYQDEVDRDAIQYEFDHLNDELNQIADTDFNGVVVLNGGQMADGTKAIGGKFDYDNKIRAAKQLSSADVTAFDGTKFATAGSTTAADQKKTNANIAWNTWSGGAWDRTDPDATQGPESFNVTFEYDGNGGWKAIKASDVGIDVDTVNASLSSTPDSITNAADGKNNGGFTLYSGTTFDAQNEVANVVIDTTNLKAGDTIVLTFNNPLNQNYAPGNASMDVADNGAKAGTGKVNPTNAQVAPTVDVGTGAAAATNYETLGDATAARKMTKTAADSYNALQGAQITTNYTGGKVSSINIKLQDGSSCTLDTTAAATGTITTANGLSISLEAAKDTGKTTIKDADGGVLFTISPVGGDGGNAADYKINGGSVSSTLNFETVTFKDEQATVEIANPADNSVSKANAYGQASAPLTYTDHIALQAGARTKDLVDFTFKYSSNGIGDLKANMNCSARADGLGTSGLSLKDQKSANYAIDRIDQAINKVSMVRATFGAVQNRLEHKIDNMNVTKENITSAESRIRDTNMAEEMTNFTKNQILSQASQAMLAQANQLPQGVLQLLG
ncbi:MAG: hypothetical protein K2K57_07625, partial [Oscillospiraceae bacterium]|nr:hypothetical protein [Oscillospiraceae bacterium]